MRSHSMDVRITTIGRAAAALLLTVTVACDSTTGPDATPKVPVARIMPGQIVFVDRHNYSISVADSNGATLHRLSVGSSDFAPAVSADGTKIAFSRSEPGVPGMDIWVMNADGSNQVRLTRAAEASSWLSYTSPTWSPDGERIAFVTSRGGVENRIFVMNADGSELKQITDDNMDSSAPEWSPDGSRILFSHPSGRSVDIGIFEMNQDGSNVRRLNTVGGYPTRSPDGTHIAFVSGGTLFVMSADGSDVRALTNDVFGVDLTWSPDGNSIVFGIASTPLICLDDWFEDFVCGFDQDLRRIGLDGVIVPNWKISSAASPVWQR